MAKTCPNCQYSANQDNASDCIQCGAVFPIMNQSSTQTQSTINSANTNTIPSTINTQSINNSTPQTATTLDSQITGRITWINESSENADFNWYKFLSQMILFLLLFPLFIIIFTISTALWLGFAILGFQTLSRGFSPFNLAYTINSLATLIALVFPRVSQRDQVPVVRLTVQTNDGERPSLLKGELTSGTFRMGDEIRLQGEWREGTMIVNEGYNQTLNTKIAFRRDYWHIVLIILLILITTGAFLLMGAFQ